MNETLSELLKAVLIAAVPVVLPYVIQLLQAGRAWVESHTRNQWLLVIEREAFDVVAFVGQTMIDPAKKALADGKLDENEKAALKSAAMAALTARLHDVPTHLFPDLVGRLGQAIESAVAQQKVVIPANPQPGPASK